MRKIIAFTNISVDGFFAGPNGEIDWFKGSDDEEKEFSHAAVNQPATLIFGRTTYEMMAGYWPARICQKRSGYCTGHEQLPENSLFKNHETHEGWPGENM